MTKLTLGPQVLHFSRIHAFPERNKRPGDEYGKGEDTKRSLAVHGWMDREFINGQILSDEDADRAYAFRQSVVDELKVNATKNDDARLMLLVLTGKDGLWVDKAGRLVRPDFEANMCYRRISFYPESQVMRVRAKDSEVPVEARADKDRAVDILSLIPVNVKEYKDEADRIIDQLMENEKKTEGAIPLSHVARINAAEIFWKLGYKESQFRAIFKDGVGQKIYSTYKVDHLCPEANLIGRGKLKAPPNGDPMYVNLQSLSASDLRKLYTDKPPGYKIPVEAVEGLIANIGGKTVRPIGGPQLTEMADHQKNDFYKEILSSIATGQDQVLLGYLVMMEAATNELVRIRNAGKLSEAVVALKAIDTTPAPKVEAPVVPETKAESVPETIEAAPAAKGQGAKKK